LAVGEGQVRRGIAILGAGVLGLAALLAYGENRPPAPALPEIQINGNRQPAGQVREGVLYVRLEVMGSWHPEGLEAPGVEVASFGVENGPLQNLGPVSEKSIFEPGHTVVESASLRNYFFRAD